MAKQPPSKIVTAAADVASRTDPKITPTRVNGWIRKGYILRPTMPLKDEYVSCLIDLAELTGRPGHGKSIGVVTSLAYRGYLQFVSHDVLRADMKTVLGKGDGKQSPDDTIDAAHNFVNNTRTRDNPERAAFVNSLRQKTRQTNVVHSRSTARVETQGIADLMTTPKEPVTAVQHRQDVPDKHVQLIAHSLRVGSGDKLGSHGAEEVMDYVWSSTEIDTKLGLTKTERIQVVGQMAGLSGEEIRKRIDRTGPAEIVHAAHILMPFIKANPIQLGRTPSKVDTEQHAMLWAVVLLSYLTVPQWEHVENAAQMIERGQSIERAIEAAKNDEQDH